MEEVPLLFYANESDPDFLHVTGFHVPDPIACLHLKDRTVIIVSELELERAKSETKCEVVCQTSLKSATRIGMVSYLLEEHKVTGDIWITPKFPCDLYQGLRDAFPGLKFKFLSDGLSGRRTKSVEEISALEKANGASRAAFACVRRILQESEVTEGSGVLVYRGAALTSEVLKREIEISCIQADAMSFDTIAAGGVQSAQPHCSGSGPLRAGEFIICDVFPKHRTGYFGDMTRTFLKGKPTAEQEKMVAAVRKAHDECEKLVHLGVHYKDLAEKAFAVLGQEGYPKETRNGIPVGMIHGLGHGVGLEIHEEPRVNARSQQVVQAGDVFTIEPGIYYPELGGVRIEDSYWVGSDGALHKFQDGTPYDWVVE